MQRSLLGLVTIVLGGLPVVMPDADAFAAPAAEIRTRHAVLVARDWQALPGWEKEAGVEPLATFRRGCSRLHGRPQWRGVCDAANAVPPDNPAKIRAFFEREFVPYELHDPSLRSTGLLTGYFEPTAKGDVRPGGRFIHPVYGVPDDLILLDARSLPQLSNRSALMAKVEGATARLIETPQSLEPGVHSLDLSSSRAMPLDRRLRLRLEGGRLLPYPSRQEIETGARLDAPVLAWIDDPDALYIMQVQGSGRIRFPDGRELRLGYGEQNGHPFAPRGIGATSRTRGIGDAVDLANETEAPAVSGAVLAMFSDDARDTEVPPLGPDAGRVPRTRSVTVVPRVAGWQADDAAVDRAIEQLLSQARASPATMGPGVGGARFQERVGVGNRVLALYRLLAARRQDPSYVFFRPLPAPVSDASLGPPGALGAPLTPGRSVAVDPRVTPLGAPVFISAQREGTGATLNRLVVAQDVGGAIRGAVRADLFWGRGALAGNQALQTRDRLSMWVLLPRSHAAAEPQPSRTRGIGASRMDGGNGAVGEPSRGEERLPDCVFDDGAHCVD